MRPQTDYVSKRVGKIVIVGFHHQIGHNRYWLCQCDCGNQKILRTDCLKRTGIKSCGCSRRGPNNSRWNGVGDIHRSVLTKIRDDAKIRNLDFRLTLEYLWKLFIIQNKKCALTGDVLNFGKTCRDRSRTASLDRIDPTKGYIETNVQWVHKDINFAKQSMTNEKFIDLCWKVTNNALVAQMDEQHGPNVKDAGSTPAKSTIL